MTDQFSQFRSKSIKWNPHRRVKKSCVYSVERKIAKSHVLLSFLSYYLRVSSCFVVLKNSDIEKNLILNDCEQHSLEVCGHYTCDKVSQDVTNVTLHL